MSRRLTILAATLAMALLTASCGSGGDGLSAIATPDGETLAADIVTSPGSDITVVLAHMRGADRSTWDPIVGDLNSTGYNTLAFDFRGYGDSSGKRDTNLDIDLAAAVDQARSDGAATVVLIGASMGGTAVLAGGAALGADGVIAISAPGGFLGLDGAGGAADISAPVLLIDTEGDRPYVDDLTAIEANTEASLITFSGSAHGTAIFSTHDAEITSAILDFLESVAALGVGY